MRITPNGLIASLTKRDRHALLAECKTALVQAHTVLSDNVGNVAKVYFLTGASIALLVLNAQGVGVAVGLVTSEGAVGLQRALGLGPGIYELFVQSSGTALTIGASALNRLMKSRPAIHLAVSRYLWTAKEDQARFAVAMQSQSVTQRLAGWILRSQDLRSEEPILLTHEHLARMLGVRRSSVSLAASELRGLGLIEYNRGRVNVRDATGLLAVTMC